MRLKTCTNCGRPFRPSHARAARCDACSPSGRDDRSPTTRAQDAEYHAERARILTPGPGGPPACYWCGDPATTADHLRPVARGGHHRGNLVPACAACNASRGARDAPKRDPAPARTFPVHDELHDDEVADLERIARLGRPTRLA